jgi:hypothetical protein
MRGTTSIRKTLVLEDSERPCHTGRIQSESEQDGGWAELSPPLARTRPPVISLHV